MRRNEGLYNVDFAAPLSGLQVALTDSEVDQLVKGGADYSKVEEIQ